MQFIEGETLADRLARAGRPASNPTVAASGPPLGPPSGDATIAGTVTSLSASRSSPPAPSAGLTTRPRGCRRLARCKVVRSPGRERFWARCTTCRPSRSKGARRTRAATSSRSAPCSSRCCRDDAHSKALAREPKGCVRPVHQERRWGDAGAPVVRISGRQVRDRVFAGRQVARVPVRTARVASGVAAAHDRRLRTRPSSSRFRPPAPGCASALRVSCSRRSSAPALTASRWTVAPSGSCWWCHPVKRAARPGRR